MAQFRKSDGGDDKNQPYKRMDYSYPVRLSTRSQSSSIYSAHAPLQNLFLQHHTVEAQNGRHRQEDRHFFHTFQSFGSDVHIFGVLDGHGGSEVVDYCQRVIPMYFQAMHAENLHNAKRLFEQVFQATNDGLRRELPEYSKNCGACVCIGMLEIVSVPEQESATDLNIPTLVSQQILSDTQLPRPSTQAFSSMRVIGVQRQSSNPKNPDDPFLEVSAKKYSEEEKPPVYRCTIANLGDTRALLARRGRVERKSFDHKASDKSEQLKVKNEGGVIWRGRLGGSLAVTRALGDFDYLQYGLSCEPHIEEFVLTHDCQVLVLATDGLFDVFEDQQVVDFIKGKFYTHSAEQLAEHLKNQAIRHGSTDNVTVMVLKLQ